MNNMPQLDPIKTFTDQDGDIIMSDTLVTQNLLRDKSTFDWFSFEGKTAAPKSPAYSPVSPNQKLNISASTASPSSYFTNSPFATVAKPQGTESPQESIPPKVKYPAPPTKALKWVWQCHLCSSRYPLAVTRRCLVDGHYYCSGNSQTQRNVKKRRRNQSCTSEFDYVAWKEWGQWRRKTMALHAYADQKEEPKLLGCEGCCSPSQCRYESRERVERIKFDDYIEEDDLIVDQEPRRDHDQSVREEKPKSSKRIKMPSVEEEKDAKNKKSISKKGLEIDSTSLASALGQKASGRHRFYSSLSSSLSTRDLSPTSDSLGTERGKFDPTLPSVTRPASNEKDDLTAIESALRAALTKQKQPSTSSLTTIPEEKDPTPPQTKRRLNSKKDDPQFEITAHEILNGGSTTLTRTRSQSSLLTDFFRPSKPQSTLVEPAQSRNCEQPASETDITTFLRSTPTWDIDDTTTMIPQTRRKSSALVPDTHLSHFEDIELSGTSASTSSIALSQQGPTSILFGAWKRDIKDSEMSESDAGKMQVQDDVKGGLCSGGGNAASRGGLTFGVSFGFGRK